ncbi:hypothetical protein FVE85_8445 [Porphyridium purpureum]|uniref:Uncharacterized protein n=1 Tax=Porphyridium purpureum TaxID=35688 RepID=A0A5J4YMS7_PORPP|nr:hypothetical protein FVE85_8445 [Porphyridium purpureum]|eukprot:POR2913..scf244_11
MDSLCDVCGASDWQLKPGGDDGEYICALCDSDMPQDMRAVLAGEAPIQDELLLVRSQQNQSRARMGDERLLAATQEGLAVNARGSQLVADLDREGSDESDEEARRQLWMENRGNDASTHSLVVRLLQELTQLVALQVWSLIQPRDGPPDHMHAEHGQGKLAFLTTVANAHLIWSKVYQKQAGRAADDYDRVLANGRYHAAARRAPKSSATRPLHKSRHISSAKSAAGAEKGSRKLEPFALLPLNLVMAACGILREPILPLQFWIWMQNRSIHWDPDASIKRMWVKHQPQVSYLTNTFQLVSCITLEDVRNGLRGLVANLSSEWTVLEAAYSGSLLPSATPRHTIQTVLQLRVPNPDGALLYWTADLCGLVDHQREDRTGRSWTVGQRQELFVAIAAALFRFRSARLKARSLILLGSPVNEGFRFLQYMNTRSALLPENDDTLRDWHEVTRFFRPCNALCEYVEHSSEYEMAADLLGSLTCSRNNEELVFLHNSLVRMPHAMRAYLPSKALHALLHEKTELSVSRQKLRSLADEIGRSIEVDSCAALRTPLDLAQRICASHTGVAEAQDAMHSCPEDSLKISTDNSHEAPCLPDDSPRERIVSALSSALVRVLLHPYPQVLPWPAQTNFERHAQIFLSRMACAHVHIVQGFVCFFSQQRAGASSSA